MVRWRLRHQVSTKLGERLRLSAKYERPRYLSELGKKLEERYEEAWKVQELRERLRTAPFKDRHATSVTSRIGPTGLEDQPSALRQLNLPPTSSTAKRDAPPTLDLRPILRQAGRAEGPGRSSCGEAPGEGGGLVPGEPDRAGGSRAEPEGQSPIPSALCGRERGSHPGRKEGCRESPSSWEAIEFYGTGLDTLSTDTRVYWLVEGSAPGQRIRVSDRKGGPAGSSSFPYTVERRDRTFYFRGLKNGDQSNFFGPRIYQRARGPWIRSWR